MHNTELAVIFIVIPVYNRKALTRGCLYSLQQQTDNEFRIIVVDDGSTDGTDKMIQNEFPNITLLKGDGNLWWTGAVNKAVQHVLSECQLEDYILLLNDDLVVPPDYFYLF